MVTGVLPSAHWKDCPGLACPRIYSAGASILRQNDPVHDICYIERGVVKLSQIQNRGEELIVGFRSRGWMIGTAAALAGAGSYCDITALTECAVRTFSTTRFIKLLRDDRWASEYCEWMHYYEMAHQTARFASLATDSACYRFESFLSRARHFFLDGQADTRDLRIPLKQREIAQFLSITPEHLSRILRHVSAKAPLKFENGCLILSDARIMQEWCARTDRCA
jgi:CRP-like cAMP-binding protein